MTDLVSPRFLFYKQTEGPRDSYLLFPSFPVKNLGGASWVPSQRERNSTFALSVPGIRYFRNSPLIS